MADESDTVEQPDADAATQPLELPAAAILAPGSNADGSQDGDPGDWQPPQTDEQGFAIDGHGLPINLRRRALTLADRNMDEDPTGYIDADGIDQARDQLAAYDEQYPSLSGMTKAALTDQADQENVQLEDGALVDDIRAAIIAARPARI
jgi:hypothetical protein